MENDRPKFLSKREASALALFFGATTIAAVAVLLRWPLFRPRPKGESPGPAAAEPERRLFDQRRAETRRAPRGADEGVSSLDMIVSSGEASFPGPGPATEHAPAGAPKPASARPREKSKEAPGEAELSKEDAAALRAAGGPSNPKNTRELGAVPRALWTVSAQLAKHPAVLGFLLNNKYVVSAYMNRPDNKEACSNPKVMANFFANTHSEFDIARQLARTNPEVARVAFGSELFKAVGNCPGMQGFASDQSLVMGAVANPSLQGLLSDPAVLSGLTSNPNSAQVFGSYQKSQAGP